MSNATQPTSPAPRIDVTKARSALTFFKVMAFVVGIGLLVLVLEMILKYVFHNDVLSWWPMPHGFLYVVYLACTANLGFAAKWPLGKIVGVMLAGVVPFLSFVVERKVAREVDGRLAA